MLIKKISLLAFNVQLTDYCSANQTEKIMYSDNLFAASMQCLKQTDVSAKLAAVRDLKSGFDAGTLNINPDIDLPVISEAGHPAKPDLVPPRDVPKRKLGTDKGRAAAIHSFCHIEFNAINLACDAVYRFRDMPHAYYADWIKVAFEEAYHFELLQKRLREIGYEYGDFPAHNGLWELAQKTADDSLHRMALIPRLMEARGLDVTPFIQRKFRNVGDIQTVEILDIILRDEIGHVEAGSRWFRYLCEQRGVEPESTYIELVMQYMKGDVQCPTHRQARLEAGFSEEELNRLQLLCQ